MPLRRLALAASLCALLALPAQAERVQIDVTANQVQVGGGPYALLTNASAAGAAVPNVMGAAYEWCTTGTFGGASLQLQALGPDGSTYMNVGSAITSAGCTGVVIGQKATVKVTVTGGSPSALYSSLS